IWNAKTVWIRKGTVINKMLDFLDLKYPSITSITEVPIEKAMTEYRTYLTKQGVRITTTNYKITANQEKTPVKANSYYVTNLRSEERRVGKKCKTRRKRKKDRKKA